MTIAAWYLICAYFGSIPMQDYASCERAKKDVEEWSTRPALCVQTGAKL